VRHDEAPLTAAIIRLASAYRRYGYRRVTALLRAEGWRVIASGCSASGGAKGLKYRPNNLNAEGCG
jgi:transposase InsO family protein